MHGYSMELLAIIFRLQLFAMTGLRLLQTAMHSLAQITIKHADSAGREHHCCLNKRTTLILLHQGLRLSEDRGDKGTAEVERRRWILHRQEKADSSASLDSLESYYRQAGSDIANLLGMIERNRRPYGHVSGSGSRAEL